MTTETLETCSRDVKIGTSDKSFPLTWLRVGILGIVALGCLVLLAQNQPDADLWGHIQYGRDALTYGLPETSTYNYTAEGYRWINHENIPELLLAIGADTIGITGLQIVKCLLAAALLFLIAYRGWKQGASVVTLSVILVVVSLSLAPWWTLRPQLMSFVLATCLILLLDFSFGNWSGKWHLPWLRAFGCAGEEDSLDYKSAQLRWLWLIVPLIAIWTNSHAGFGVGLCLFIAYLCGRGLEALTHFGTRGWGLYARFVLMIGAAILATFLTPYGPNLHKWLLTALSIDRPEISEWNALDPWSVSAIPYLALIGLIVASVLVSKKERDFTQMLLIACVLWQTILHERHVAFLALLAGFWLPQHVQSFFDRVWPGNADDQDESTESISPAFRYGIAGVFGIAILLLGARLYLRVADMPVPKSDWPISAFQYMADRGLKGKIVCNFNWAQYCLAAFGVPGGNSAGGLQLHFDGRMCTCYPQSIIDEHFDFVLGDNGKYGRFRGPDSPPRNDAAVLDRERPDLVLLDRKQPHSVQVMAQQRDTWLLLYQDATSQLWGRRSRYDDPTSPHFIPLALRSVSDAPQPGNVSWPAFPQVKKNEEAIAKK